MARARKPLAWTRARPSGAEFQIRFYHPVKCKTVRFNLGGPDAARANLAELNRLFLDPTAWRSPVGFTEFITNQWGVKDGPLKVGHELAVIGDGKTPDDGSYTPVAQVELQNEITRLKKLNAELHRKHRRETGKTLREHECPALSAALTSWLETYRGRDADHIRIIGYDLERFVAHFGPVTVLDAIEGREKDIDKWLRGLTVRIYNRKKRTWSDTGRPLGAGRRAQIRRHVLRFLADCGALLDRRAVTPVRRKEIRNDRGQIRWLNKPQAEAVAAKLAGWGGDATYMADLFRVQVGLGLRPDELITLKAAGFGPDLATLTLSPLAHLTLKQGSRTVKVPATVRAIVKRRLEAGWIVFPELNGRSQYSRVKPYTTPGPKPWRRVKWFNRVYRRALQAAAKAAGIPFKVDCRTGRRTCASLLLRAGHTADAVAAILGDDAATVREHYAAILPHEVDPTAAALE